MSTLNSRALRTVVAKTADYTVKTSENGTLFTNLGASGAVVFALPAATVGLWYAFQVHAAQALRVDPDGTEVAALHTGVLQAAGKYVTNSTAGGFLLLQCIEAGKWHCGGAVGTWTAEG